MSHKDKNVPNDVISFEIPEVKRGEVVTVKYCGDLTQHSDGNVYLHYGFDGWKNTATVPMARVDSDECSTSILVHGRKEINIAFKDDANHWDNNNGQDYKIEI